MERIKEMAYKDFAEKKTKPTEYWYLRVLRRNVWFINIWPSKEIGEHTPKYSKYLVLVNFAHVLCLATSVTGINFISKHKATMTFYDICHIYISIAMGTVAVFRIFFTLPQSVKYKEVMASYLTKMHLFYFKNGSDYAMKTHKRVHLISHFFTIFLTAQMTLGILLFNVTPMWNNYIAGKFKETILVNMTYEVAVYYDFPGVYTNFNAYVWYCLFGWFISYLSSTLFCMLDLLLSLMVFNLWGHLKILLHDLASFPLPAKKSSLTIIETNVSNVSTAMYSEEELVHVSRKLKECIQYHRLILNFANKMSDAFGQMLFMYYIFYQVCGCLLLLECSQMTVEALMRYLPLTFILFQQLIQLSVIFELIGSRSEKLTEGVYSVPWQCMDTKNRRTVAIFLLFVQKPIHVKAQGLINVGVTTMAGILKTSFSYFAFLRSTSV